MTGIRLHKHVKASLECRVFGCIRSSLIFSGSIVVVISYFGFILWVCYFVFYDPSSKIMLKLCHRFIVFWFNVLLNLPSPKRRKFTWLLHLSKILRWIWFLCLYSVQKGVSGSISLVPSYKLKYSRFKLV